MSLDPSACHNQGHCLDDCPMCELDAIGRQMRPSTVNAAAYYVANDADGEPTLWRITDDVSMPAAIVRRCDVGDRGAWELLEQGVNVAHAAACFED